MSAEVGKILSPVNSPLHQDRVRVRQQERRFTTIWSRNWFTPPFGGSPIPQIPEGINQRPPLGLRLKLRRRLRLTLSLRLMIRRPTAQKVDSQSPFELEKHPLGPFAH